MKVRTWTDKDARTLRVVREFVAEWGVFPSYAALGLLLGVKSSNAVGERLQRLEAHGKIEKVKPPRMSPCWRLTGRKAEAEPRGKTL